MYLDRDDKFVIALVIVLVALGAVLMYEPKIGTTVLYQHTPLYSMKDNMYLHGDAVIFGGSNIDTRWEYTYYFKRTDGFVSMGRINSDEVLIRFSDTERPYLDVYKTCYTGAWTTVTVECYDRAIVTIPPGSVEQSYNLNGE